MHVAIAQLTEYRHQLDEIDYQIVELMAKRQDVARAIAELKLAHDIKVQDPEREQVVIADRTERANIFGIDEQTCKFVFEALIDASRQEQESIINKA